MKYEIKNCTTHITYSLENDILTISRKNKIIYNDLANKVIILHIKEHSDIFKNKMLTIKFSLPNYSYSIRDTFKENNLENGRNLINELKKYCEFLDLSSMKAESYKRKENVSEEHHNADINKDSSKFSNDKVILKQNPIQKADLPEVSLSRHDKKRLSVIQKVEKNMLIFDISHGVIQDGINKTLPNVKGNNIVLKRGEICHYCGKVEVTKTKNVVVGSVRNSYGMSSKISKSGYARFGQSQNQVVRADMVENTKGILCVTSERIILTSQKYGFDKHLSKLTGITPNCDGITIQFDDKIYNLLTRYPTLISEIISVAIGNV